MSGPFDIITPFCMQYICFHNIDHFEYPILYLHSVFVCEFVCGLVCQQSHPLWFSVRQLQRQAVVCQQYHHLWFSVCQLQRYQEMTEFYDVSFLAPPILNAQNKIFGPKLAHSSSSTYLIHVYFPYLIKVKLNIYAGQQCKNISESILYVLRIRYW